MKNYIDFSNPIDYLTATTNKVCFYLEEIGWSFERKGNNIQVSFQTGDDCKVSTIVCVIEVREDKLYITTSLGIKVTEIVETLKFINFVNCKKIYFGRFVVTDNSEIWYDYTISTKNCGTSKDVVYNSICIADGCAHKFCNQFVDVANGYKTADEATTEIK